MMNSMGIKAFCILLYKLIYFNNSPHYYKLILEESTFKDSYGTRSKIKIQLPGNNYNGLIPTAVKHWNNLKFDANILYHKFINKLHSSFLLNQQ